MNKIINKMELYLNVLYTSIWGLFNHFKAVEGKGKLINKDNSDEKKNNSDRVVNQKQNI